jgi:hypothetical protein
LCFVCLIQKVQTSASVAAGTDHVNPNLRARRQVVSMLGTVVVFFFICLLPFKIFTLWFILTSDEDIQMMGPETYYHVLNFCRVMFYLNSAINPILYNVMSSKFRTAFLKALGFTWAGRRKRLLRHLSRQSIQHDHHVWHCLPIGHDDQQRAPTHQTDDQGGSPDSRQQSKARPAKIRTTRQLYCCKPGVQQTATDGHSLDDVHQRHGRQQSAGIVSHRQSRLNHKQVIETKENKLMDLNF